MKVEKEHITVDCAHCEATVKAEVLATHEAKYFDEGALVDLPDHRVSLAVCPACHESLLAHETWRGEGDRGESLWSRPVRVWPQPERETNSMIPDVVRVSLDEAQRCHRAAAYTACAVMCGRALEGVCIHFETKERTLAKALPELLERELIDQRLFNWGDELRKHRNIAAHATGQKISRDDATDLLEFLAAICEYVFVLTPRFQAFMDRKAKAHELKRKGGRANDGTSPRGKA